MIRYQVFRRKFMTWMQAGFNKIGNINDLQELPYGCILHVLDNFPMDGRVDWGPRITNCFMHMNNFKVFMHNVTSWPEHKSSDVAPIYKDKMIMTSAGVMQGTMKYMRDMMPRVKFSSDMKGLPVRPSTMSVVNYNPLFRARCLGVRKKVRFFNFLLAYMCNKIMEDKDRQHFIHVPLEPFIYEKKDFIRVFRKFDRIATLYPERSSYLFLAHFYGLLSKNISLPKRGTIPEDEKEEEGTASTESLVELVPSAEAESNLEGIDFMSALAEFSHGLEAGLEGLKEGENPYTNSMFEYIPPAMFEKINFIFTAGEHFVCYNLRDIKELNGRANVGIIRIINQLNMLVREGFANAQPDELVKDETVPEDIQTISETKLDKGNTTTFTVPLSKQDKIDAAEIDMIELDNVDKIIADLPSKPTPKQEEKIRHLSKAYKTLTIDGLRFDKLLAVPTDDIINPPTVKTQSTENGTLTSEATRSTTAELGKVYIDTQMSKDIAAICTSFNKQGMFLVDFKEEEVADELSVWKNYQATYEDTNHKTHKIKFSVPKFDSMGRCKVNGTMKAMKIQRVSRPICKVSPTRVTINSNYNKALIERNTNSSHNFLDWFSRKALFKINNGGFSLVPALGVCKFPMKALPYEYTALGSKYHNLTYGDKSLAGGLFFDYDRRPYQNSEELYDGKISPLERSGLGVWFGWKQSKEDYDNGKSGQHFFIDVTGLITVKDFDTDEEPFCGAFGDFIEWLTGISLIPPVEHIDITYLSKTVPLIHVLAYRYGLTNMLKYCKCDYMVRDRNERVETRPSDIIIKFKDKKLIINRTPRVNALLFGGLAVFDLDEVFLEDMDNKDVYYTLLEQVRVRMGFIKGVDSFFDLFIDPITRDVLRDMRAPTDMRDLLLYTVTLLTTSEHLPASSESNFRYRNIEQVTAIIYNEMARAFAGYKNKSVGAGTRFSISEYTIRQRIVQDQNMEKVDTINPIADIKTYSNITNAGTNGRTSDTFLLADRMFTKDALGIVSEATVDNGKVGMNAILPANPKLVDSRGMTESVDPASLEPENILSMNSLVMPAVTQDDGKRANFSSIQASAVVPMKVSETSRIRTGFEELVAHRTRPPFAFCAEDDGVVLDINESLKTMVIKYKNGKKVCVRYGEEYSNNTSNGFFVNQDVILNGFKKGDKFGKNDVLTYNREFFQADPFSKSTVRYKLGVQAHVAILDNGGTIEDASILTQPLCEKMEFYPVHQVDVVITPDTNIRSFAKIGDFINSTEPIAVFDESPFEVDAGADAEYIDMLSKLNTTNKKAGHTGTVVKIEALYACPVSQMTPSLQKLVKYAVAERDKQSDYAKGCENASDFVKSVPLPSQMGKEAKVGLVEITSDVVMIRFYIKQIKGMSPGDKLFFGPSLKSVCSQVYPEEIEVEDGSVKVGALTSARGILQRIISSPFITGIGNRVLEKAEQDILAMWDEN